jgi:uncharacterized protein (UPF0332 family)
MERAALLDQVKQAVRAVEPAEAGRWTLCVNRRYDACFYAVSALLVQRGLSSANG